MKPSHPISARALTGLLLVLLWSGGSLAHAQDTQVTSADPPSAPQGTVNLNVSVKGKGFKKGAQSRSFVTGTTDPGGIRFRGSHKTFDIRDDATFDGEPLRDEANFNTYTFLFGPRFTIRKAEKVTPFFHTLFGVARVTGNAVPEDPQELPFVPTLPGLPPGFTVTRESGSAVAFSMAVGGGLDVSLGKHVAMRLIQADYLMTRFGERSQNNFRAGAGIVLRFGSR